MALFGVKAKVDMLNHQFKAVYMSDEWEIDLADAAADVPKAIGILLDKPRAGHPATVSTPGDPIGPSLKGWLAAAASAGDLLKSDGATGKLTPTTTDKDRVIAIAMQDGVADDIIQVIAVLHNHAA